MSAMEIRSTDDLMKEDEVAKRLKVSVAALRKWRLTGGGPPFVRVGAHLVRYQASDVDAWVTGNVVTSTSAPRT